MTDAIRIYAYGVGGEKNIKEFLHTFLSMSDAKKYCKAHAKIFPGRFDCYMIGDHKSNVWEMV